MTGTAFDIAVGAGALILDFRNDPYCPTAFTDGEGIPVFAHIYASNEEASATALNLADGASLTINSTAGSKVPVIVAHQSGVGSAAVVMKAPG
jgi:hypothetical protein